MRDRRVGRRLLQREGGAILVGVKPDGTRVGIQTGKGSLEGLANEIKQNTDPHTFPRIHIESEGEKEIVRVEVDAAPLKPVPAYGIPYLRVGRTDQRLTTEAAYELRQQSLGQTWDGLTTLGVATSALPKSNVARFVERLPDSAKHSPDSVLMSMGLEKEGRATNAAVLLFDGSLQSKLPQAVIKCARFEGRAGFAQEPVTFDGTIVDQIDDALAYVHDRTNRVAITGAAAREVRYQYPPAALREAIVNAVCHRDYTQTDPIHVRIYDERLEIWNPGEMPAGLSVEALFRDHPSRPRNIKIAHSLDKLGFIERFGSGTLRIAAALDSADQPPPDFISEERTFRVRFYRGSETHPVISFLSERQRAVMTLLRERGRLTTAELEGVFHLHRRTLQLDLRKLIELRMAAQGGAGPSAFYQPTDQWKLRRMDRE